MLVTLDFSAAALFTPISNTHKKYSQSLRVVGIYHCVLNVVFVYIACFYFVDWSSAIEEMLLIHSRFTWWCMCVSNRITITMLFSSILASVYILFQFMCRRFVQLTFRRTKEEKNVVFFFLLIGLGNVLRLLLPFIFCSFTISLPPLSS